MRVAKQNLLRVSLLIGFLAWSVPGWALGPVNDTGVPRWLKDELTLGHGSDAPLFECQSCAHPEPTFQCPQELSQLARSFSERGSFDLRQAVGKTITASSLAPVRPGFSREITYDLSVRGRSKSSIHDEIVAELVRLSRLNEPHREVAALYAEAGSERVLIYYSSNSPDEIERTTNRDVTTQVVETLLTHPVFRDALRGEGVVLHRYHTHVEWAPAPHSGDDIMTEFHTYQALRTVRWAKFGFLSHVIPLEYGGDVVLSFDPSRFQLTP